MYEGLILVVINNMKIIDEQSFIGTSVSADRWMPLQEVREPELIQYLLGKKSEGYTLLGIEQASNSKSLHQYIFPKKTVLLLGKEKEGIPVNYIHILDAMVEIPQFGMIRSLNVHVSASIALWEYVKQGITKSEKSC